MAAPNHRRRKWRNDCRDRRTAALVAKSNHETAQCVRVVVEY